MRSSLPVFSSMDCAFDIKSKHLFALPLTLKILSCFLIPESCIILCVTFKSVMHFEFILSNMKFGLRIGFLFLPTCGLIFNSRPMFSP